MKVFEVGVIIGGRKYLGSEPSALPLGDLGSKLSARWATQHRWRVDILHWMPRDRLIPSCTVSLPPCTSAVAAMGDSAAASCPRAVMGVEWLMLQAARVEGQRPAEKRSRDFLPVMEQIAARTAVQPDEDGAERWQRELKRARMETTVPLTFNPTRLLSYVAGRPIGVVRGVVNV